MTQPNEELVRNYMQAAERALDGARFNLDGGYFGITANRAYYAFFYAASALLLTRDITRSKHSGVLSAFRQHFVKSGEIEAEFSDAYGEAFDVRLVADYEMVGTADEVQAREVLENARRFVDRTARYLAEAGYS